MGGLEEVNFTKIPNLKEFFFFWGGGGGRGGELE